MSGNPPPHDLGAEQAVISACVLSPDGFDIIQGIALPEHCYSPTHRHILSAIYELKTGGRALDAVSIRGWLKERGRLEEVGGAADILKAIQVSPAIINARQHAETVRDKARLRALIFTCERVAAEGYGDCGDVQRFIDETEHKIFDIARLHARLDVQHLSDATKEAIATIAAAKAAGASGVTGAKTGFDELDRLTTGLHDGELFVVAGRPGMGKALRNGEVVLTPTGWKCVEHLKVGDLVMGEDGEPKTVRGVYPQGRKRVCLVQMSDGESAFVCWEHLWQTRTRSDRRANRQGKIRTTGEIAETLCRPDGGLNHSIQFAKKMNWKEASLPVHPYVLGVWIGDGSGQRIYNPEQDVLQRVELLYDGEVSRFDGGRRCPGLSLRGFSRILRGLELNGRRSHEKFIPKQYLLGSADQRSSMLRGLCDTDGYVCDQHGKGVEFCTTSEILRDNVKFLVWSLGGRATSVEHNGAYRKNGERIEARRYWRINLSFPRGDVMPVSSEKHLKKWVGGPLRLRERYIESVSPAGESECTCIKISGESGLFVTRGFIVTHNTSFVLNAAANMSRERIGGEASDTGVVFFSLEMPKEQLAFRLLAAEAHVDVSRLRSGALRGDDWIKLTEAASRLSRTPFWIDDTPALTLLDLRSKVRRLQARIDRDGGTTKKLGLVAVDYIQLMQGRRGAGSREQEVSELSRGLKQLAKEAGVPVVALSQLNRSVETRSAKDKRPQLSDLRESGAIEQDADTILFLYRDEYYFKDESVDKGIAEVIIAKQRNGPTATIKTKFTSAYTRFDNLARDEWDDQFENDLPDYCQPEYGYDPENDRRAGPD